MIDDLNFLKLARIDVVDHVELEGLVCSELIERDFDLDYRFVVVTLADTFD